MKAICIYHNDLDGFASAAIVRHFLPDQPLIMYPINYGLPFPWDQIDDDTIVYMVDFSLQPWPLMESLTENCKKLIWIDHHTTSVNDYNDSAWIFEGIQRVGIGACELTWEYFNNDLVPEGIKLLSEYDVWNHSNPDCLPFQYGMRARDNDPADDNVIQGLWKPIIEGGVLWEAMRKLICSNGQVVLNYKNKNDKEFVQQNAFELEFEGVRFIAVNKLGNSLLFDNVFDSKKHDAMMTFAWIGDKWSVSMYSPKGGIDVGKIAKKNGGGGHENASGFQTLALPFKLK